MTGTIGVWLAAAAILLLARRARIGAAQAARSRSRRVVLVVTAGTSLMRADAIERFTEFLGLRDRVEDTRVESYAHRTLLAYIGGRIWLDHPIAGVGWQASSEEWAYGPHLDDARKRFPDEPDEAFPSPEHPWGVQTLYLQVLADAGVIGFVALVALCGVGSPPSEGPAAPRSRSSASPGSSSLRGCGRGSGSCRGSRSTLSPGSRWRW